MKPDAKWEKQKLPFEPDWTAEQYFTSGELQFIRDLLRSHDAELWGKIGKILMGKYTIEDMKQRDWSSFSVSVKKMSDIQSLLKGEKVW